MRLCIFTEPQEGATYDQLLAVARTAEECGFEGFFRSDHLLAIGPHGGPPGPTDAWLTLAALGRETRRLRLGTLVSPVTFRHPGLLAVSVAQADQMSGGRVELGLGAGWFEAEHAAYGIPFPPLGERFQMFEEQLAIISGMWQTPEGQRFSYSGKQYQVKDSPALPKPVQRPRPPIIIGGKGLKRTPALAARWADEFNTSPVSPFEEAETMFELVRQACRQAGRDAKSLRFSATVAVCCGRDEAEFRRRAQAIHRDPVELRERALAGTPAEVRAGIARYAAIGADRVYLQVLDLGDLAHIELLGAEVLARL